MNCRLNLPKTRSAAYNFTARIMKIKSPLAIQIGAAAAEFTPALGLTLLGQMHKRIARSKRDALTANAIAFRQGSGSVVLVSVDLCILPDSFVRQTQQLFAQRTGLPAACLLLHSTHTHVAPSVFPLLTAQADPRFVSAVQTAILHAATRAVHKLAPGEIFSGTGSMEHMGWNRRAMFKDGSSRMYSSSTDKAFIGLEGPRDPALPVLWVQDAKGTIQAIVVNFATHPNCLADESIYSADLPGEVRRQLQATFGPKVVVVYLTGAAGNTAPKILDPLDPTQPWLGETGIRRSGLYLASEVGKVMAGTTRPMTTPLLRLKQAVVNIPIRPWPKPGARIDPFPWLTEFPHHRKYYEAAKANWPQIIAAESPVCVTLNVIRIGDTALCTNSAELFVEFGLQIRQKTPARVTFISELTDGYVGYVPTLKAYRRGGYETWPAPTSKLAPSAGGKIVATTAMLLQQAFAESAARA